MAKDLVKMVLSDKKIAAYCQDNQVTNEEIEKYINEFLAVYFSNQKCLKCPGLDLCEQTNQGLKKTLEKIDNHFEVYQIPCSKMPNMNLPLLTNCTDFKEIDEAEVYNEASRRELTREISRFVSEYQTNGKSKGIIVNGSYGSGKTFLMKKLALKLAKDGYQVEFLYFPELVRKLKMMITTGGVEQAVKEMANVDILFWDDFGAENITPFIRDDVIACILQKRMEQHLPIFMTTNLDNQGMIEHLATIKDETDLLTATRLWERFMSVMNPVDLKGIDYRK